MTQQELSELKSAIEGLTKQEAQLLQQQLGCYGWVIPVPVGLTPRQKALWLKEITQPCSS